ncbi:MAG TPA: hypothetical protein VFW96_12330 [Thermomicrobiales bacterium]|nr:hypothetical protein [Thermomicrobiales bacterium]
MISPLCALSGCQIGRDCYIATGAMVFQGATIGDASRVVAGAIVHLRTVLPPGTRVGLRHIAVPDEGGFAIHPDARSARAALARADFFRRRARRPAACPGARPRSPRAGGYRFRSTE